MEDLFFHCQLSQLSLGPFFMFRPTKFASSLRLICFLTVASTVFSHTRVSAQTVVFSTNLGDVQVELAGEDAPLTVANFLSYVNESTGNNYDGTFFHRSIVSPNLSIIQGGGFYLPIGGSVASVPSKPPVVNEFGISNTRGTIAMAKLGGNPDSATNQWFFNTADNSANLDAQNGGFTVFGTVTSGMDVVDAIQALNAFNLDAADPGTFDNVPLIDSADFVAVNSIYVLVLGDVNLDDSVDFADISPFISVLSGSEFQAEADTDQSGTVDFRDISPFIRLLSGQ